MALAFDAVGAGGSALPGNSITYSHTCTGTNLILIVAITSNNTDVITGVTYNGDALTLGKKSTDTGPVKYFYYKLGPATGAHDVVVSASAADQFLRATSVSYTGVQQSGQPDATDESRDTATSTTTSLTQVVNNAWQVGMGSNSGAGTLSAGTGIGATRGNVGSILYVGDSNAVTSAGTQTLTWNNTSSTQLDALQFSLADIDQSLATTDEGRAFFM